METKTNANLTDYLSRDYMIGMLTLWQYYNLLISEGFHENLRPAKKTWEKGSAEKKAKSYQDELGCLMTGEIVAAYYFKNRI